MANDLSRALRASPAVNRITRSLDRARQTNRELKKETERGLSPVEVTTWVQLGACLAGGAEAFLPDKQATTAEIFGSLGLMGLGSAMEQPYLVALGNGMIAGMTKEQVKRLLTRERGTRDVLDARELRDSIPGVDDLDMEHERPRARGSRG